MSTKPVSKTEQVYLAIRERIIDGTYSGGFRLVFDALAREFGVSAVPVREAIRRLQAEGLVTFERNIGAQVTPHDAQQWRSTIEVISLLEGRATALAAPLMRESDFKRARKATQDMQDALETMNSAATSVANRAFHQTLVEHCDNLFLVSRTLEAYDRLDLIQREGFRAVAYIPRRAREAVSEHDALLELMETQPTQTGRIETAARRHRERTIKFYEPALANHV
jgi:DNA-binding GntR family transcriptional regulator